MRQGQIKVVPRDILSSLKKFKDGSFLLYKNLHPVNIKANTLLLGIIFKGVESTIKKN